MERVVGSLLRPNKDRFRSAVNTLRERCEQALMSADRSLDALREAHNAYTRYTALCLMHITGHRPVLDPFCYRSSLGDGFAVIEDKAVTEKHACRAVILPPTAMKQLEHYKAHLNALRIRLATWPHGQPIATAIVHLLRNDNVNLPLPWFFFLGEKKPISLSPGTLEEGLSDWPWPLNAGRHQIATELRIQGVPAELIALQLGHLQPDQQFCGAGSSWSLQAAHAFLSPALDALAIEHGWQAIPGLTTVRPSLPPRRRHAPDGYVHGELGPEVRKAERAKTRAADQELVSALIRSELAGAALDQVHLDTLFERIRDLSADEPARLGTRLRFLWDWAINERIKTGVLRLPRRVRVLLPPPPPFWRNMPRSAETAARLRTTFVEYLKDAGRAGQKPTPVERAAEIVVSAALLGGLILPDRLTTLIKHLPDSLLAIGKAVVLDIPATETRSGWRWVADDVTAALLSRLPRGDVPTPGLVIKYVGNLLNMFDPDVVSSRPIDFLAEIARAYWLCHLPGFLYATTVGETATEPLPVGTLMRLINDVRLTGTETDLADEPEADIAPLRVGRGGSKVRGFELDRAMREIFTRLEKKEARGHDRSAQNLKRNLAKALRAHLATAEPDTPAIAMLVVAWAIHLAEHGTRNKRHLAFNSVTRYIKAVSRPLIESASDADFLNLDELDYETLYSHALNYREGQERGYLAGRLWEFHTFLMDAYGIEGLDWSILQRETGVQGRVDANFLTPTEYRSALNLLLTDPAVDEATRLRTSAMLVIGYRFGPRVSDVLRLRDDDLEIEAKIGMAVIHVRANFYGTSKSEAGIRQIPLVGTLTETEWTILARLKAYFDEYIRPQDPLASLFVEPQTPRAPIERSRLLGRVHLALRLASGDASLRFQHLRHSYATRLIAALFSDTGSSPARKHVLNLLWNEDIDSAAVRQLLTGTDRICESTLQAVAVLLGHANVTTTLHNYVHVMEWLAQALTCHALPPIADWAWSYALGEHRDTVRKRLSRQRRNAETALSAPVPTDWPQPVPAPTLWLARGRPPSRLPGDLAPPARITLEMADRILLTCTLRDGKTVGLADRLMVPEAAVERLVQTARHLEASAGWLMRSVSPPEDRLVPGENTAPVDPGLLKETPRLRKGLRTWQERLDALNTAQRLELMRALEAWNTSLLVGHGNSIYKKRPELVAFLRGLDLLGISRGLVSATVQCPTDRDENASPVATLMELGLGEVKVASTAEPSPLLIKFIHAPDPFAYTRTLFRGLYVLRVTLAGSDPL